MIDIQIVNDTHVRMQKMMWHESELVLARCLNFDISEDNQIITASIPHTAQDSMAEFIKFCFKNFSESLTEQPRRETFYSKLSDIYDWHEQHVLDVSNQVLPYAAKFYKHQREGIRFCFYNRCNFLAYSMRLGKSIVAASLSRIFQIQRTLIVCPSVAKMGWFRDLTDTWGYNPIYFTVLDAAQKKSFYALNERFVIVNYDTLKKYKNHIISGGHIGHIIIDEAHRIKNRNSDRFGIIHEITNAFPEAKITMLSGTAIPNRFNDLFAYFKLTNHHLGQNYTKFVDQFTITKRGIGGERVTGAKNIAELQRKISNFMIVRTMEDCFDMPDDIISRYTFEMDDYRTEYDKIIDELSKQKSISSLSGCLHSLNIITSKSKLKGTIEAIEEIVEETGKIVVFGSYTEPLHELKKHFGKRCVLVDGSVPSMERYKIRTAFMEDPSVQVFLGNYDAAGEALDLSIADDVLTLNFPMTPRPLYQGLSRIRHPEKRNKKLRIHYTFAVNSIDQLLFDMVADKTRDINALLHDGKEVIELENMNEILIKKLLHRDDIVFKNNFSKDHGTAPGEEGVEIKEPEEVPPVSPTVSSIDTGVLPVPGEAKYYLVLLTEINTMAIYNEAECDAKKLGPHEVLFSHEDHTEVIKQLRHKRLTFTGHATEKYTPNARVTLIYNGATIQNTPEQIQKLSEITREVAKEAEPTKTVTIAGVLTPPPGFL